VGSANAGEVNAGLSNDDLLFSAYLSSAAVSSSELFQRTFLSLPLEGSDIHFEVISTPAAMLAVNRSG